MSFPWLVQASHNKAAISEGLKIVRKVIARDAKKTGLSTTEIYKRALREPPHPSYSLAIAPREESEDEVVPEVKYGRAGRRRIPPPTAPHPRHPVRSISFLKHNILPIIQGERRVRHIRETRLVTADKGRSGPRGSKQQQQQPAAPTKPTEAMVWLWQAMNPAKRVKEKVIPPRPPIVYDFSHMKASKRKAHRARTELAEKRAELEEKRRKLKADVRHKIELEVRAQRRTVGRARHEAEEAAALAAKADRRKRWEKQNPILAKSLREAAEQKSKPAPSKKLRA